MADPTLEEKLAALEALRDDCHAKAEAAWWPGNRKIHARAAGVFHLEVLKLRDQIPNR